MVWVMMLVVFVLCVGEVLWDIGGGLGLVSVEWCLNGGSVICFELCVDCIIYICVNIVVFGLIWM